MDLECDSQSLLMLSKEHKEIIDDFSKNNYYICENLNKNEEKILTELINSHILKVIIEKFQILEREIRILSLKHIGNCLYIEYEYCYDQSKKSVLLTNFYIFDIKLFEWNEKTNEIYAKKWLLDYYQSCMFENHLYFGKNVLGIRGNMTTMFFDTNIKKLEYISLNSDMNEERWKLMVP